MKGMWLEEVFALPRTQSEGHSWGETVTARTDAYSQMPRTTNRGS